MHLFVDKRLQIAGGSSQVRGSKTGEQSEASF